MTTPARNHLQHYLIGGYALLIAYASLYPLSGWHDRGGDSLSFFVFAWPRYYTGFDIATNVLAYIPLGFLLAAAGTGLRPLAAGLLAVLACALLSFTLEWAQNFLPTRVPSILDFAGNSAGGLLGAGIGARWGHLRHSTRYLALWRRHVAIGAPGTDLGILLMAGWLMTQLSPEILLFGTGDLRQMLDLPPVQPFAAERFNHVEATIAAGGLLAAMLICQGLLRRRARVLTLLAVLLALLVKAGAHALIAGPAAALAWLTAGAGAGLAIGLALWGVASTLSAPLRRVMAALALLFATVMVNVAPENPYLHQSATLWQAGQFLNFNGLTRLICSLWPFLALSWLMTYRPEQTHETHR